MSEPAPLTRKRVLSLAWPVVLSQAAMATTGVVDTGLMGKFGDKTDLAAVGIAAVTFSFVYWGLGFLRMTTTGLTAQAQGAGDARQGRAHLVRALTVGGVMGVAMLLAAPLIRAAARASFSAEPNVETLVGAYFDARIWGAPAALMGYAVSGWLLGMGRTRSLLLLQVVLGGANAGLDIWFTAGLDWGPAGIGAGTAIAEWIALLLGLVLVRGALRDTAPIFDRQRLRALLAANRDIMLRTLALLFSFAWFVNSGARIGTAALAGNEVLLQFITVAAFVLDAFAFIAETEIGVAIGARDRVRLRRAMRVTTELALACGVVISLIFLVAGAPLIRAFVADPEARAVALAYLPYCAAVPLVGVTAWQLDGAFLGATQGRALRIAAIVATSAYVVTDLLLAPRWANTGVWIAFVASYAFRALSLGAFVPSLLAAADAAADDVSAPPPPPPTAP